MRRRTLRDISEFEWQGMRIGAASNLENDGASFPPAKGGQRDLIV